MSVDWSKAIERNRTMLLELVAELLALAGYVEGGAMPVLSGYLRSYLLRILRPAESTVRRLILIAARGMTVELSDRDIAAATPKQKPVEKPSGVVRSGPVNLGLAGWGKPEPVVESAASEGPAKPLTIPPFALIDPLKSFDVEPRRKYATSVPRIHFFSDWSVPVYKRVPGSEPKPDREPDSRAICRRLLSIKRALENVDAEARRLARWIALRKAGLQRVPRFSPMRPGWPPGHRKRALHWIDDALKDIHSLALHSERLQTASPP